MDDNIITRYMSILTYPGAALNRLVYVSCNPKSLVANLKGLVRTPLPLSLSLSLIFLILSLSLSLEYTHMQPEVTRDHPQRPDTYGIYICIHTCSYAPGLSLPVV